MDCSCVYPVYVSTYKAVADAILRDDIGALRSALVRASQLEGPEAVAATAAHLDAMNRVPMRAKVHICRLLPGPPCSTECRESARSSATVQPAPPGTRTT